MNQHATVEAVAGDDWQLAVTLQNAAGAPIDISGNPPILWSLATSSGRRVIEPNQVTVAIVDGPAGKASVTVPAAVTTGLMGGLYQDALRLTQGGVACTMLAGEWHVYADPLAA